MLHRLYIKNIALISEADIEFDKKLNVLSGETGSGKSVILDSINFVLGSKADRSMLRFGEQEAIVRAEFSVEDHSAAAEKLREFDIETDGDVIISRKLTADGKNSIKINGNTVTAAMLKAVAQRLVDVHGQSEHFFLLSEDNQLKVIDDICGDKAKKIKSELSVLIAQKREYRAKIASLGGDESERARRLDILKFQMDEIEKAEVKVGELENLKARRNLIANTEKIFASLSAAHAILSDDGGSIDGITSARRYLDGVSEFGQSYADLAVRLEELAVDAQDIAETISDLSESLTFDEQEAQFIEERLELLKTITRKYGGTEESVLAYWDKAQAEYDAISDSENVISKLNKQISVTDDKIYALCRELTALRKGVAADFCKTVTAELATLNIANAKFEVEFGEYDRSTANLQSADGSDNLGFAFSANKGEPLKPLSKVISGGEMSRFMLAVKTVLKNVNGISTYIFDEIDAGISGFTAKTVAEKFIKISKETQIIAVSHLPQICAASTAQFLIYKEEEGGKTLTHVKKLTDGEKLKEIVRLTGGRADSEAALQNARELIKQFS